MYHYYPRAPLHYMGGHRGNHREIALKYICSHATYGTSHGSAKNFVNTVSFFSHVLIYCGRISELCKNFVLSTRRNDALLLSVFVEKESL